MNLWVALAALAAGVLALIGVCLLLPQVYRDREYRDDVTETDDDTDDNGQ